MLCKVIHKFIVSTSHLTRTISRDLFDAIFILPSVSAVPPGIVSFGIYLHIHPPPYNPVLASKSRRRESKVSTDDAGFGTVTVRVLTFA